MPSLSKHEAKITTGEENFSVMDTLTLTPPTSIKMEGCTGSDSIKSDADVVDNPLENEPQASVDPGNVAEEQIMETREKLEVQTSEIDLDIWNSEASLYCPLNGRSHATVLDFGLDECPLCQQDLLAKREQSYSDRSEPHSPLPNEDSIPGSKNAVVTYSLEYMDSGDNSIGTVPWPRPFDLSTTRNGMYAKKPVIFNVTTVLGTSIPSDSRRYTSDKQEILEKGIIDNPRIQIHVRSTRVTIHSKWLLKAISHVITYYPPENFRGESLELNEPYLMIGHYLKDFETYRATYYEPDGADLQPAVASDNSGQCLCDQEAFDHLGVLLDFIKTSIYKSHISDELDRHSKNLCTFRMLWLLFKPGETVYMQSNGQRSAYVIKSMEADKNLLSTTSRLFTQPYTIELWNLQFDGRFVGRSSKTVTIGHFDGEREITSLKIFPCHFIDKKDGGQTRRNLENLGRKWYKSLQGKQVFYSGEFLGPKKRQFQGRVYVDPSSYFSEHPKSAPDICEIDDMGNDLAKCTCEDCHGRKPHPLPGFRWSHYDLLDPSVSPDLELPGSPEGDCHRYFICSRLLYGFVLKSRTWEELNVACCQEPKVNKKAIDSLVMPKLRKDMIEALVQKYTDPSEEKRIKSWGADFIENKGEGQIFLLHGSPGVGKTFTAECIAEYTGRALLSLTCGDIGIDEMEMEKALSKWFQLAEKWGAVMLIDEADVYLERRQITDLKRNSLVSVFLRCIEYYRGILFLTTNRVGHFDDAFISRIHVVIRYENLKEDDRKLIWKRFFDKLSDDRSDFIISHRAKSYVLQDEVISKMNWNGREIRNAFQTAVALAEYRFAQKSDKFEDDVPTLDQKDFEDVCNMTREFKDYLMSVHGTDEDGRAFHAKARASDIRGPDSK